MRQCMSIWKHLGEVHVSTNCIAILPAHESNHVFFHRSRVAQRRSPREFHSQIQIVLQKFFFVFSSYTAIIARITQSANEWINWQVEWVVSLFLLFLFPASLMTEYLDQQVKPSRYAIIRWFGFDQFEPERAFTSYWVSSKTFFIIRFIIALYSTIVFWAHFGIAASASAANIFFSYFTTLTFVGLHSYLVVSLSVERARQLHVVDFQMSCRLPVYTTFATYGIRMSISCWISHLYWTTCSCTSMPLL